MVRPQQYRLYRLAEVNNRIQQEQATRFLSGRLLTLPPEENMRKIAPPPSRVCLTLQRKNSRIISQLIGFPFNRGELFCFIAAPTITRFALERGRTVVAEEEKTLGFHVQWYPGHMTKTRRQIQADLKLVDLVAEIIDARIPISSRNPDIDELVGEKPRLIVLNRADQADPAMNRRWGEWFRSHGWAVLETNAKEGKGVNQFSSTIKVALRDKLEHWKAKGLVGRTIRVMVVGIPNVGKSTFINQVAKRKSAKAGDRPGVTRGKQWVAVDAGLDLLDTPGILWPKFDDQRIGMNLAFTGAVKDEIMDIEMLACRLLEVLAQRYPKVVLERYKVEPTPNEQGWELLERCGRKRGFLIAGGEVDLERMSKILLDEFRGGKLGCFTLESPEGLEDGKHGDA